MHVKCVSCSIWSRWSETQAPSTCELSQPSGAPSKWSWVSPRGRGSLCPWLGLIAPPPPGTFGFPSFQLWCHLSFILSLVEDSSVSGTCPCCWNPRCAPKVADVHCWGCWRVYQGTCVSSELELQAPYPLAGAATGSGAATPCITPLRASVVCSRVTLSPFTGTQEI